MNDPYLKVIRPGLYTTIQDAGRIGFSDVGLTPSGVLDQVALRLANALVGNKLDTAALEIIGAGPTLVVEADSVRVAIAGGTPRGTVTQGDSAPVALPTNRSFILGRGDQLSIDSLEDSSNCVLAIAGGFDIPNTLGSCATYARANLGGLEGRPLLPNDLLPLSQSNTEGRDLMLANDPANILSKGPIQVVIGPQEDAFSEDTVSMFLGASYKVGHDADRMGLRLEGPKLPHLGSPETPSDGIAPGSIQVPGTQQPIVLLAERGTVGGYPKIATVASAELPRIGRVRPGETVQFSAISRAEAEALRRQQATDIQKLIEGAVPAPALGASGFEGLLDANLISGVWGTDSTS